MFVALRVSITAFRSLPHLKRHSTGYFTLGRTANSAFCTPRVLLPKQVRLYSLARIARGHFTLPYSGFRTPHSALPLTPVLHW